MIDLTPTMSQLTEKHSEFGKDVVIALINLGRGRNSLKRIKREENLVKCKIKSSTIRYGKCKSVILPAIFPQKPHSELTTFETTMEENR
jgi:hypothetical protein